MNIAMAILAITFPPEPVKHAVDYITQPYYFITLSTAIFALMFVVYKWWTKPGVALALLALFCIFYFGSIADENFRSIVAKPDNVPITIMVISVMCCLWMAFRRAALSDSRVTAGLPLLEEDKDDK